MPHELFMNYIPWPRNSAFLLNLLQLDTKDRQTNDEKRIRADRNIKKIQEEYVKVNRVKGLIQPTLKAVIWS